jgi:hypothetical protein
VDQNPCSKIEGLSGKLDYKVLPDLASESEYENSSILVTRQPLSYHFNLLITVFIK